MGDSDKEELGYQNNEESNNQYMHIPIVQLQDDLVNDGIDGFEFDDINNEFEEYLEKVDIFSPQDCVSYLDKVNLVGVVPYHMYFFLLEFKGYHVQYVETIRYLVKVE